jgi:hypothetical protein
VRGAVVNVKGDAKTLEGFLVHPVIMVYDLLGSDPFLPGLDGDGNAVFIGTADKNNVFSLAPQVTGINVCRNVNACQVPYMHRSVGIWQGGCNEMSAGLFHICERTLFIRSGKASTKIMVISE